LFTYFFDYVTSAAVIYKKIYVASIKGMKDIGKNIADCASLDIVFDNFHKDQGHRYISIHVAFSEFASSGIYSFLEVILYSLSNL
jgi:hypothetical protein